MGGNRKARGGCRDRSLLKLAGELLNAAVSFVVFSFLDVLDVVLCAVYKVIDYAIEAEWKPCYCESGKNNVAGRDMILVPSTSVNRGPKVVRLCSAKLQLEDVSGTLYSRPSRVTEFSWRMSARSSTPATASFTVSKSILEMLKGKISPRRQKPLWSDCNCKICNAWSGSAAGTSQLYVHAQGPAVPGTSKKMTDVLFIHGFISSSDFWTETVFREFTAETLASRRLFAVDLLGFGRSPKPAESLYTLREHVEMIERSVLERHGVRSFHVVAHSLGCIIALALAARHPDAVRSLTLLAPPYFPAPRGEEASQFIMRRVAPRRVWPAIAFGASMACWYEHVSRTICLLICRNHRLWHSLFKFFTGNRIRGFMIEVFMCHTHNAAWHTLHNVICGSAEKMESCLAAVRDRLTCDVRVFHGGRDELLPVRCSYDLASRIPRARVKVFPSKDHVTVVVGQQRSFARELERIWARVDSNT